MYFFKYIGQVLVFFNVLVMCHLKATHKKVAKEQSQKAFSDVLKNITIANKILEDLIKNYERLETIYKSEELSHSRSGSSEIDEKFKNSVLNKKNKKQRDRSHQKYTTSSPYIGTAVIYDSESMDMESEDTNEENNVSTINSKPIIQNDIISKKIEMNIKTDKNKANAEGNISENKESEEVEEIIIEIPKEKASAVFNKMKQEITKRESNKTIKNILGEKTRFSVQYAVSNKIDTRSPSQIPFRIKNNGRRIKRIVYSETFSPDKIWDEIVNKPIRLKRDNYPISQKSNKANLRSTNKKITIIILTNNEQGNANWEESAKEIESESNTREDLTNLNLLNKILRNTYGEVCLLVPINKCKKALKTVSKNVCKRRFKCKSDFKSDFIDNSIKGCDKEFTFTVPTDNITDIKIENEEKFSPPEFGENQKYSLTGDTRGLYKVLAEYKLQPIDHFISLRNETPPDAFLRRKAKDKYEKRCQKETRQKCINACHFALDETCSVHTCENKQKKAFKRECKDQCKKAYEFKRKKATAESSEDSESESDSGSE